jgi:acetyl esterase
MIDPESQEFLDRVKEINTPPIDELTPQGARDVAKLFERLAWWDAHVPVEIRDMTIPGERSPLPARVFTPEDGGKGPLPVLVYFHGGGFVLGGHADPEINSTCSFLADAVPCVVVSVGYRLAPEHKFPAAVEDAYAALRWVSESGHQLHADGSRIAVGGDSAGGNIAAVVSLMARDRRGPRIALQVLVYPVIDHSFETASYRELGEGYGLSTAEMRWYWNHYLTTHEDGKKPYASPLREENLAGLPPALVIVAGYDPLKDEAEAYGVRLEQAGVPTAIVRYDGAIHGFFTLPFGGKGRLDAATELRKAFSSPAP